MKGSVAVLTGNGNPEAVQPAITVLDAVGDFEFREATVGQASLEGDSRTVLPAKARMLARASHAVLLGPLGDADWESLHPQIPGPEAVKRGLQEALNVHAVLRPVVAFEGLPGLSLLKSERVEGTDFVVVHGIGDFYYGSKNREDGSASDVAELSVAQVKSVAHTAFNLARTRRNAVPGFVTSVDKANVMETSKLWRQTIEALQQEEYPDIPLKSILVDNAQAAIVNNPSDFDVIVSGQMFGDVLNGAAAGLIDHRLLPTAHLNPDGRGVYRPLRYGGNNAIPLILSAAELLKHSFNRADTADAVRRAVAETIKSGVITPCLGGEATDEEFTDEVIQKLPRDTEPEY